MNMPPEWRFPLCRAEDGARVKEIAPYIGDLESTTERYYIAIRKKVVEDGETQQVVMVPTPMKKEEKIKGEDPGDRGGKNLCRIV